MLLALTVIVFSPAFFGPSGTVAASPNTDVSQQFGYYRQFGFNELRHGRLALWSPYIFSGCPFLGGWQEGLLYPPNWIYLLLPLSVAMNVEIALHVFLVGLGTFAWVRHAGAHRLAALLSGCMIMFGAPVFLHVYAGHMSMVDAMAMAPWLLLAIDGILERPAMRWVLLGMGALGLQLLAGHPQTVFDTVMPAGIYAVLRLVQTRSWARRIEAFAAIGIGAVVLSSAQLVAGFAAAAEGVRHGGVPYGFAAMFSFPPENFLTLLAPNFFGNMSAEAPYWGRCYLWEASLFVGVVGFALAIYGASRSKAREKWIWLTMVALTLILALAAHTPLFHILYSHVPGFNRFRAQAKFVFPAGLFIAMLAGQGASIMLADPKRLRGPAIAAGVAGMALGIGGLFIAGTGADMWSRLMAFILGTGESYFPSSTYSSAIFQAQSRGFAADQCLYTAGLLIALAAAFFIATKRPKAAYAIVAFGIAELVCYALSSLGTMDMAKTAMPAAEHRFLAAHPGDYRILQLYYPPDDVIGSSTSDIWGYDPTVLGRYAEFMYFAEGRDPNQASSYLTFMQAGPLLRIARCKYVFISPNSGHVIPNPLPHVFLASNWIQVAGRDAIFAKLASSGFDPAKTAVIETPSVPAPQAGAGSGTAMIIDSTSDTLTIQADVPASSLLVITDPYSRDWRASPLPGAAQAAYTVIPCDYAFMAIPLSAGHHVLRLRYRPNGFISALWLMGLGWVVFVGMCVWEARRWRIGAD